MKEVKEYLEVGDKIAIKSVFGNSIVEIARVTKTMAITKPINASGYEMRFKLKTFGGMPQLVAKDPWSTTKYQIINNQPD